MFAGTPEQLAAAEKTAKRLADQICDLLNQLEAVHHGSTSGHVQFLGGEIRTCNGRWTVHTDH